MNATLTDGRRIEFQPEDFNPFGQVYLERLVARGLAPDIYAMADLLGAAPSQVRYGMVHPEVDLRD